MITPDQITFHKGQTCDEHMFKDADIILVVLLEQANNNKCTADAQSKDSPAFTSKLCEIVNRDCGQMRITTTVTLVVILF